jgi:hypothetical protein
LLSGGRTFHEIRKVLSAKALSLRRERKKCPFQGASGRLIEPDVKRIVIGKPSR